MASLISPGVLVRDMDVCPIPYHVTMGEFIKKLQEFDPNLPLEVYSNGGRSISCAVRPYSYDKDGNRVKEMGWTEIENHPFPGKIFHDWFCEAFPDSVSCKECKENE